MTADKRYEVKTVPVHTKKPFAVEVPGSKSITNRALLLAALADGRSILKGVLFSDDSRHFLKGLQALGFQLEIEEDRHRVTVYGQGGKIPAKEASVYVGSAGTAARFLTAMLGFSKGKYYMDASEQMKKRPMAPLLTSLRELGVRITCDGKEGYFPFTLEAEGLCKQEITVNIEYSSQFLSALLMSACMQEKDFTIHITGKHALSYIHITTTMMEEFGCKVEKQGEDTYVIRGGQTYVAREYQIEPDVSAACYFFAMAPLLGTEVTVKHLNFSSMQGDMKFLELLMKMGCSAKENEEGITVYPPKDGILKGIEADMGSCSDQTMTMAALAPFADSPVIIRNIGHIRYQESDRIKAIVQELTKLGIVCEDMGDAIRIEPGVPKGGSICTYEDHRMAMAFSLIGLRVPGIVIEDPLCCAKTFENYFEILNEITG